MKPGTLHNHYHEGYSVHSVFSLSLIACPDSDWAVDELDAEDRR
jgi:hypothetical protein